MNAAEKSKIEDARERLSIEVVGSYDDTGRFDMDKLKENLSNNLEIDTSGMGNRVPTGTFYLDDLNFYIDEDMQVIYGENFVPLEDGSWNSEQKVNSPELFEGMTAIYWDEEGTEHELTDESTKEEWNNWYDYTGEAGTNKWANAVTKDENGNYIPTGENSIKIKEEIIKDYSLKNKF